MGGMIDALRIIAGILGVLFWAIAAYIAPKYRVEYFDTTRLTEHQLKTFDRNRKGYVRLRRALPYFIAGLICFVISGLLSPG
jgi:hypothetical protein